MVIPPNQIARATSMNPNKIHSALIPITVFVAMILCAMQTISAQAQSKSYDHLKVLGPAGKWSGTGIYRDNRFTCEMERTWSGDKGALLFTQRYYGDPRTNDKPGAINTGMFGWDPAKKKIKCCWFITDGRSATSFYAATKNRLTGKRYLSEADGTESVRDVTFDLHADGSISYKSIDPRTKEMVLHIEWKPVKD